ncbi:MAG: hypothetical protein LBO79_05295 [Zoogloeaceae bacterium]|nr:hypothetical protein [Zoogloeaceae bacterium]
MFSNREKRRVKPESIVVPAGTVPIGLSRRRSPRAGSAWRYRHPCHPARAAHRQPFATEPENAGVPGDMIRFSIDSGQAYKLVLARV